MYGTFAFVVESFVNVLFDSCFIYEVSLLSTF